MLFRSPRTIVTVRPIGVVHMIDGDESDDKIIAVNSTDPRYHDFRDITDIPEHTMLELKHFFETYKELEKKKVQVLSFENAAKARKYILDGLKMYKEKYSTNKNTNTSKKTIKKVLKR